MDERLQCEAMECLRIMCTTSREAQRRVMAAGGLKAVTMAVTSHSESARLQQEAIAILAKLSMTAPEAVMASGGLESITHIMDLFPSYSWIQMWGCQAIKHLGAADQKRVAS